jgi:hypothetical protein
MIKISMKEVVKEIKMMEKKTNQRILWIQEIHFYQVYCAGS